MAPPADLRKIGVGGFALIDKLHGPPTRKCIINDAFPSRQGRCGVQVPNDEMEEPAISSKDAAVYYGGIVIVNYTKGKPQNRWGRSVKP